ncbi:Lin1244/Lin1753 domain-containing protein [Bacillus benzoevorans]|uniref:DnaD/phage-associated family protein n=1 Tax=Bacillus benzoevorans TaxID=1456 RepID=A0A7X0HTC6_9BACI|nr:Lin1244/Lin1753 domain-containing protein [Bacillus benzoevorans]MBB6446497.1 DnaD/phage-associated family protein [Bacillus benzoevorans]
MAKDAYYFSHDSNAHKDPKILKLRAKHGWEGYGIYWAIIETLREQDDYKWLADDKQLLSFCFANGDELVNQVIETCLDVGLLIDDGDYIFSQSLSRRMKMKDEISEKRRAAGKKGGSSKKQANAKQIESKESKGKEIKVKESEVEEAKEDPDKKTTATTTEEDPSILFEKSLCRLSEIQRENLYSWENDFNGQREIINEAIKIADNKNKRYFGFVEYLLKEWANNKLDSLDRVRVYEQEKFRKENDNGAKVYKYDRGASGPTKENKEPILGDFVGRVPRRKPV